MKLTILICRQINVGLAWQFNYKRAKKNVPTKCRDAKFIVMRPYCRCGLTTRNCQLRFNYFHNNITPLEGNTYFITKRFFVKNFF